MINAGLDMGSSTPGVDKELLETGRCSAEPSARCLTERLITYSDELKARGTQKVEGEATVEPGGRTRSKPGCNTRC